MPDCQICIKPDESSTDGNGGGKKLLNLLYRQRFCAVVAARYPARLFNFINTLSLSDYT